MAANHLLRDRASSTAGKFKVQDDQRIFSMCTQSWIHIYTDKEGLLIHIYSSAGLGNHGALYGIELTAGLGKPRREVEHVSYFETTFLLFFLLGLAGG